MSISHPIRFLRRAGIAAALFSSLGIAACGDVDDLGQDTADVTDIQHSEVKNQSIGNCWIYASLGWAESLHLRYTSEELNISESYVTYWHWFEQIRGGAPGHAGIISTNTKDELTTGGWWGVAGEISLRYGMMSEGDFIPTEAESQRSARQRAAKNAINASLKDGVLSDLEKRKDASVVRDELNKAWALDEAVVADLDGAFGSDVSKVLYDRAAPEGSKIFAPRDVAVGHVDDGGARKTISLADAFGTGNTWNYRDRSGTYAWKTKSYPSGASARRSMQIEIQRAMHASQPVILSWLVDFNAMSGNHFKAPPENPGRQGGHLIVLEDYTINNVPGHGTLAAGQTVLDPDILEAALSPEAEIEFFRIKNSWGESLAPDNIEELKGYHDLYMAYLNGPIKECVKDGDDDCASTKDATPLRRVIMPPQAFIEATEDTCDEASYATGCSGEVLQWCDAGKLERFNCTDGEWTCAFSEDYGDYDCVDAE